MTGTFAEKVTFVELALTEALAVMIGVGKFVSAEFQVGNLYFNVLGKLAMTRTSGILITATSGKVQIFARKLIIVSAIWIMEIALVEGPRNTMTVGVPRNTMVVKTSIAAIVGPGALGPTKMVGMAMIVHLSTLGQTTVGGGETGIEEVAEEGTGSGVVGGGLEIGTEGGIEADLIMMIMTMGDMIDMMIVNIIK